MGRGADRRRSTVSCTVTTKAGKACRLVPRWRCPECATISCGIHIARAGRQTHCPACSALPIEIERRRGDRRKAIPIIADTMPYDITTEPSPVRQRAQP